MRPDEVFKLILTAFRGFCLLIPEKQNMRDIGKKIRLNAPPRLIMIYLARNFMNYVGKRLKQACLDLLVMVPWIPA